MCLYAYLFALFAEIMSKDFDFKKFRFEVGGHQDLASSFQKPKKKRFRWAPLLQSRLQQYSSQKAWHLLLLLR